MILIEVQSSSDLIAELERDIKERQAFPHELPPPIMRVEERQHLAEFNAAELSVAWTYMNHRSQVVQRVFWPGWLPIAHGDVQEDTDAAKTIRMNVRDARQAIDEACSRLGIIVMPGRYVYPNQTVGLR